METGIGGVDIRWNDNRENDICCNENPGPLSGQVECPRKKMRKNPSGLEKILDTCLLT